MDWQLAAKEEARLLARPILQEYDASTVDGMAMDMEVACWKGIEVLGESDQAVLLSLS